MFNLNIYISRTTEQPASGEGDYLVQLKLLKGPGCEIVLSTTVTRVKKKSLHHNNMS